MGDAGSNMTSTTSSSERSSSSSKCRRMGDFLPATSSKLAKTSSDSARQSSRSAAPSPSSPLRPSNRTSSSSAAKPCSGGSPTDSSDDLVSNPANSSQQQDAMLMPPPGSGSAAGSSAVSASSYQIAPSANLSSRPPLSFQQQQQQHYLPTMKHAIGFQQQLGSLSASSLLGLHEVFMGARYPFTSAQWMELEHQALMFKYIVARAPIPPEIIATIRSSCRHPSPSLLGGGSWGATAMPTPSAAHGVHANHLDAEPGRCRRTDGKKWRCARPIVPDQKYCERHINRGRHKKKSSSASTAAPPPPAAGTHGNAAAIVPSATSSTTGIVEPAFNLVKREEISSLESAPASLFHAGNRSGLADHLFQQQQQQQQALMMAAMRASASSSVVPSSCGGSSAAAGSHPVPLHSSYGAGPLSMKDRFLNGISKAPSFDLRPEQLFLSEVPGGTVSLAATAATGSGTNHESFGGGGGIGSGGAAPFFLQGQLPRSNASSTGSGNPESPYYSYSKLFHNDDSEHSLSSLLAPQVHSNHHHHFQQQHHQQQHHHHQQQCQDVYYANEFHPEKKPDTSQALRQLFNDEWPKSRDASTMTSWSDSDESNSRRSQQLQKLRLSPHSTHLSISIPSATDQVTGATAAASSHEEGGGNDSMVKLCMGSNVEELADSATNSGHHHHQQQVGGGGGSTNSLKPGNGVVELGWFSAARASVGGPLAEAFNASEVKSAGLSFLHHHRVVSPTGVLQKSGLGSFSESSSSASSPGSIKVDQLH